MKRKIKIIVAIFLCFYIFSKAHAPVYIFYMCGGHGCYAESPFFSALIIYSFAMHKNDIYAYLSNITVLTTVYFYDIKFIY